MEEVTLVVHRNFTESSADTAGQERLHQERAELLHSVVDSLDLTVKDWGDTDSERPREVVEVIIALGSAGVFTALVDVAKTWIARRKIREIELRGPNGTISLRGATAADAADIARQMGLTLDE